MSGIETLDGTDYARYELAGATVLIEAGIEVANGAIPLNLLGGEDAVRFEASPGNRFGYAVGGASDINGDGFDDVVTAGNHGSSGRAIYTVFGQAPKFDAVVDLAELDGTNGFQLNTPDARGSEWSIVPAGDINADGFADFVINQQPVDTEPQYGSSHVVFGKASGFSAVQDLEDLDGTNGFLLTGLTGDFYAEFLRTRAAGDINNDGFDDLIAGAAAAGTTYVVYGRDGGFPAVFDLATIDGSNGFRFEDTAAGVAPGWDVAHAGDVNGDGLSDVIIGAGEDKRDASAPELSGAAYVVYGDSGGFPASLRPDDLDGTNGFRLWGSGDSLHVGWSVHSAGDFNGDGLADMLVEARSPDTSDGLLSPQVYVVFGRDSGFDGDIDLPGISVSDGFRIDSVRSLLEGMESYVGAGDLNGDGYDDLLLRSGYDEAAGGNAGGTYLVFGRPTGFSEPLDLTDPASTAFVRFHHEATDSRRGDPIAPVGDVNGDGFDDFVLGAAAADSGYGKLGSAYLVYGRDFHGEVTFPGTEGDDTLVGTSADEILIGGLGNDHLDGGPGNDVLIGGGGDDVIVYEPFADVLSVDGGGGFDTLQIDDGGIVLDFSMIPATRVSGFEVVDIGGDGSNTVHLTLGDVLDLSDSRVLRVLGDADDTVVASGQGWVADSPSTVNLDGTLFTSYSLNNTTLLIDEVITQTVS